MNTILRRFEEYISVAVLAAMAVLPLLEIVLRKVVGEGIPGSIGYVQHLTLWIAFLGAALATRDNRHLSISTAPTLLKGKWQTVARFLAAAAPAVVSTLLAFAAKDMVLEERLSTAVLGGGLPLWIAQTIMPVGFALMAIRFIWQSPGWKGRTLSLAIVMAVLALSKVPEDNRSSLLWPGILAIVVATAFGAPIFTLLGGAALCLFYSDLVPLAAIPAEGYRMAASPTLPTVPLFTLAGSILAAGGASARLVRVFRAWFGWLPGGTAIAAVVVSAFFTTFTGASGVTILALGALLLPILLAEKYNEIFSIGLLTAAGSLGIVFPPCLPVILYGVMSHTPIDELFIAGLLPGLLCVAMIAAYAAREGIHEHISRPRFQLKEALMSLWISKWDVFLPIFVVVSIFSGYATLVEVSALTALYAFVVECVIYREIRFGKPLREVLIQCTIMVGGVLIILAAAMGFTNYLVDAEVPARMAEWVQARIESPTTFLLALNFFLLIVGCLMDIFSAIVVVVPLIVPIAESFGIHPVHLGIIFLVNMQMGFITPPVGMNLFLASFRFEKSLSSVYRASIPFLIVLAIAVLLITYLPALTVGVVSLLK